MCPNPKTQPNHPHPPRPLPYTRHRRWGTAYTYVRGPDGRRRQVYLGKADSPESWRRYYEVAAELVSGQMFGEEAPPPAPQQNGLEISIEQVVERFLRWAEGYYRRPDGSLTSEFGNLLQAAKPLLQLYRDQPASGFGPLRLKRVREAMLSGTLTKRKKGWSRTTINKQVGRIKLMFKWAAENELVPAAVHDALSKVSGLRRGRCDAREADPVRPVPDPDVDAILPYLAPTVRAMVRLMRLTGMRAGELVIMRTKDIDRSGPVWLYCPESHKTMHHRHERIVPIGPRGQEILRPFLRADPDAFLFSPKQADQQQREARRAARRTKLTPSQRERDQRNRQSPRRVLNDRYSTASLRHAIERACARAGVARWTPHRLRHARATEIRRQFGLEAAQVSLGHAHASRRLDRFLGVGQGRRQEAHHRRGSPAVRRQHQGQTHDVALIALQHHRGRGPLTASTPVRSSSIGQQVARPHDRRASSEPANRQPLDPVPWYRAYAGPRARGCSRSNE